MWLIWYILKYAYQLAKVPLLRAVPIGWTGIYQNQLFKEIFQFHFVQVDEDFSINIEIFEQTNFHIFQS